MKLKTIPLWYIKDEEGVASIIANSVQAVTALDLHKRSMEERRGPGSIHTKEVLHFHWPEVVCCDNIEAYQLPTPAEIYITCETIYHDKGVSEVYQYCANIGIEDYRQCSGCEAETPTIDDVTCAICGHAKYKHV